MYICYFSIDASASCRLGRFVNDSPRRYANCAPKAMYIAGQPRLLLFAIRNIQYGTELRFDYGVAKLPWRKVGLLLNCNCNFSPYMTRIPVSTWEGQRSWSPGQLMLRQKMCNISLMGSPTNFKVGAVMEHEDSCYQNVQWPLRSRSCGQNDSFWPITLEW